MGKRKVKKYDARAWDGVVVPLGEGNLNSYQGPWEQELAAVRASGRFEGKTGEIFRFSVLSEGVLTQIFLLGLGKDWGLEQVLESCAKVYRQCQELDLRAVCTDLRGVCPQFTPALFQKAAEAAALTGYRFDKYKTTPAAPGIETAAFLCEMPERYEAALVEAEVSAEATCIARDLINEPPTVLTPAKLAQAAQELCAHLDCVSVERIEEELAKLLSAPAPAAYLDEKILGVVLPELSPEALAAAKPVVDACPAGEENLPVRWAALLGTLGEADTRRVLKRLRCSNACIEETAVLVREAAGEGVCGSFLLGHESGHSIARPTACGSRVPPQRTVLGETPGPLNCKIYRCAPPLGRAQLCYNRKRRTYATRQISGRDGPVHPERGKDPAEQGTGDGKRRGVQKGGHPAQGRGQCGGGRCAACLPAVRLPDAQQA